MTSRTHTVSIVTLGCPKNEVDSAKMEALIRQAGFAYTDDYAEADVVVVNTCSFIADATEQSVVTTLEILDELSGDPNRHVIAAGCMASRYASDLRTEMPELGGVLPVEDEHAIAYLIGTLLGIGVAPTATDFAGEPLSDLDDYEGRPEVGPTAYIKIADGCDRECAFCAIPSFRGRYVSRPIDSIVREATSLVAQGAREIVLIAQDTSAYGGDLAVADGADAPSLASLIRAVGAIEGLSWVRTMYLQPNGVTNDLLATMAEAPTFTHYVEMPLQHASRSVLRAMRRPGGTDEFSSLISRIRAAMPDVVLRTTVMVGFPGETDADVDELLAFLSEVGFDYVGVFIYSPEEGTVGATLPGSIDPDIAAERMQAVIDTCDPISWERAAARVGTVLDVLVEGFDPEESAYYGRHQGQAPDIDGAVLIPIDDASSFSPQIGDIVSVRITDSVLYDLIGEIA